MRLREPILALPGDRFIIRRFSPVTTIGGGAVLDPLAPLHRRKDANVIPFLSTSSAAKKTPSSRMLASAEPRGLIARAPNRPHRLARIRSPRGHLAPHRKCHARHPRRRSAHRPPGIAPSPRSCRGFAKSSKNFHRANPLVVGIPKEDLRGRTAAKPEIFRAALAQLAAARAITLSGDLVQSAGREIALLPEEARAKELIAAEFDRAGLAVPRFEEVLGKLPVEKQRAQKILQLLLREKMLVKIAEDLVFHQSAVARLREMIANYKKTKGSQAPHRRLQRPHRRNPQVRHPAA